MDIDYSNVMTFDMQKFFVMIFVAAPVFMAGLWTMDLVERKDGMMLLFVGGFLFYLVEHREYFTLPGF